MPLFEFICKMSLRIVDCWTFFKHEIRQKLTKIHQQTHKNSADPPLSMRKITFKGLLWAMPLNTPCIWNWFWREKFYVYTNYRKLPPLSPLWSANFSGSVSVFTDLWNQFKIKGASEPVPFPNLATWKLKRITASSCFFAISWAVYLKIVTRPGWECFSR